MKMTSLFYNMLFQKHRTFLRVAGKDPHSGVVEKDEQEVHGFIFREAHGQGNSSY